MKEFKEKWCNDSRFRAKVKLLVYSTFVILVAIFAISSNPGEISNNQFEGYNPDTNHEKKDSVLEIPSEYSYKKNIYINDNTYEYTGIKKGQLETITKKIGDTITDYKYENNSYYKKDNDTYILTTKEEVYENVNYDYLNLDTIKEYISKGTKKDNQYSVYLKDIILGSDSEECVVITIDENKINVDYTALLKNFDNSIIKYLVEIAIEELE